jgi:DNA-binding response OmpR family regulator
MRVLVIEDNAAIATNLCDFLSSRGHAVDSAPDGVSGLNLATSGSFDAILLDLALPRMDGVTLCRKLREEAHIETPVLMLTARDTLDDKLKGFAHGADDYLVKPFALKEVEARLIALNRRHAGRVTNHKLVAGALTLDPRTLAVTFKDEEVKLAPKCLRLLEVLMNDPGRIRRRADLEYAVWGEGQETSDTLRSHMRLLRRALVAAGGSDPIETVHGLGYRIRHDC